MSTEAYSWALKQPIKHSTAKFVLTVIANCADGEQFLAWPSIKYLCDSTSLDRKTVILSLQRLQDLGYIEDTNERRGHTRQIVVYRLKEPENGIVPKAEPFQKRNASKNEDVRGDKSPENGTIPESEQSQIRNSSDIPHEESQISAERVPIFPGKGPKNGTRNRHGTVNEPSREPSERGPTRPPSSGRATRIDPELELSLAWQNDAIAIHPTWSPARAEEVFSHFRDHWAAKGGQDARKVDWRAAWRTWCRRERSDPGPGRPHVNRQEAIERSNRAVVERMVAKQRAAAAPYDLMTPAERAEQAFAAAEGPQPFPED